MEHGPRLREGSVETRVRRVSQKCFNAVSSERGAVRRRMARVGKEGLEASTRVTELTKQLSN